MKTKKPYSKPQLTKIQLAVQNPVLANCNSVNVISSDLGECLIPTGDCAITAGPA